ncbi:DUF429 domain-containing protein [Plebeiibacterium sediminum]|uniref:DUF429 domain-containing protein n=1 Tax=Plebeiibacterium sediminum TaxID=2992112 RepID=A0AAE3M8F2_9BACT|nr:DUF429 domain-containing protein [Plebeiobacterium sediminum]MCW3788784.1 DUF429 domain-containing protein [Plebeiobacterium sediminum]
MDYSVCTVGIDGCRGGWLCSVIYPDYNISIKLVKQLNEAIEIFLKAKFVFIDMPIGLVSSCNEERNIDVLIRKQLGHPFSSSVFTVPCKQAVYANDYKGASKINREILGKGISIQAWNICAKIKALDLFLKENQSLKSKFKETHPELCFKHLKGTSLNHKKKTAGGFSERMELLEQKQSDIKLIYKQFRQEFLKKDVADDDMLDSLVLAIAPFLV